jgi:glycosyltransferase involved in cell wall biosynthesis
MRHLAWFSPMPPDRSGIAGRSAELVAALRRGFEITVFDARNAHDFLWRNHRAPFDLVVYQLGNSSLHEFIWPYLFRYPGLAVLHDAHLHHARAWTLLRHGRFDDYRQEFTANHPDVSRDLAELAIGGFENHLYYMWPMTRLVVAASRMTALHARPLATELARDVPGGVVDAIRLGEGVPLDPDARQRARRAIRARHQVSEKALVFGIFGGLTPEKRIRQVLAAFATVVPYHPDARLLLVGAPAPHYDVPAEIATHGLETHVLVTGFVDDERFTEYLAAADVALNLRWPTAREMSGPWLRALAARVPTITTDLSHLVDIPSLDPRTWMVAHTSARSGTPEPVHVAIDILDEDHSLRLAMRRLASDTHLRNRLADAGFLFWEREHRFERMVDDYERIIARAIETPAPDVAQLPAHLRQSGERRLHEILRAVGVERNLWSTI